MKEAMTLLLALLPSLLVSSPEPICVAPYESKDANDLTVQVQIDNGPTQKFFFAPLGAKSVAASVNEGDPPHEILIDGKAIGRFHLDAAGPTAFQSPASKAANLKGVFGMDILSKYVVGVDRVSKKLYFWKGSDWSQAESDKWVNAGEAVPTDSKTSAVTLSKMEDGAVYAQVKVDDMTRNLVITLSEDSTHLYDVKLQDQAKDLVESDNTTYIIPHVSYAGGLTLPWSYVSESPLSGDYWRAEAKDGFLTLQSFVGNRVVYDFAHNQIVCEEATADNSFRDFITTRTHLPVEVRSGAVYFVKRNTPFEYGGDLDKIIGGRLYSIGGTKVSAIYKAFKAPSPEGYGVMVEVCKQIRSGGTFLVQVNGEQGIGFTLSAKP